RGIAHNPKEAIQESRRLDYQENRMRFSPHQETTQRDTTLGNIPIINPTIPGTTPIVNPITSPPPPTTIIGPPTTITGPPTTITGPPTTITGPPTTIIGPPATTTPTPSGGGSWCTSNPTASETALQVALDYACGYGGADCSAIQPNGACFEPSTIRDHASYASTTIPRKTPFPQVGFWGEPFRFFTLPQLGILSIGSGHGNCRFASPNSTPITTPITTPTYSTPTLPISPPSTSTPVNPYPPGGNGGYGSEPAGGYDYGSEPASTPNTAGTMMSLNLILLITMNCLVFSVALGNRF
ncbi:hypothetical protein MIMGU_mgv1a019045mg, partial [Erythranthe guttata]